jgi:peroxiredoxin
LRAYQEVLPAIRDAGATLVAISPELPDASLSTAEKNELAFRVLSDVGNSVARRYGLVFRVTDALRAPMEKLGLDLAKSNGDDSWELPIPATYVIAPDSTVELAFVEADYRKRLEPKEILGTLRISGKRGQAS